MRVFLYEYLTNAATASTLPASLLREGGAMFSALRDDLARCPGVQVTSLPMRQHLSKRDEEEHFRALAAAADWSLVIAPEFDDLLVERCRWVEESGGHLLGSSQEAIRCTADKLALLWRWQACGIPTPPLPRTFPLVCKPRFGAGSQATFLVRNDDELARALCKARTENWPAGQLMQQAYAPGLPASVAFLDGPGQLHALPAVQQVLSDDGRFRYRGGRLPLPAELDQRARQLAQRAVRVVDGLQGWFGVDLVLGTADDGSADVALEINPRLTTSYVGLRRLACFNLAEALLAVAAGSPPPCWQWRSDPLVFQADGQIVDPTRESPAVT